MPLPSTASTLNTYGGKLVDYSPPSNGETDRADYQVNQAFCDTSEMTRTTVQARVSFTVTAGVATVTSHQALWGNNTLALIPTCVTASTGVYNWTLPATITDQLGVLHSINITDADRPNISGSTAYQSNVTITSSNTFTIRVWDATGATPTDPGSTAVISVRIF
jgi:hypothetical protein